MSSSAAVVERSPARERALATAALVAVTAVWGSTFVVVKDALTRLPALDFLGWRFAIAALVMLAVRPRALASLDRRARRDGVLLGVALGGGYLAQTYGLVTTPASVSGFVTGLFVVLTPLLAAPLLRQRVGAVAWLAVGLATSGLALLSLHGLAVSSGVALTTLCALCFAAHIVGLGAWSAGRDAVALAIVQLLVVAGMCLVPALARGHVVPPDPGVWGALALTALAATAVAFWVQTWAQARLTPIRTAVVLTMEPVFAGVFGIGVAGDRWGWRTAAGALLILAAMLLVEVGPRHGADGAVERLEA